MNIQFSEEELNEIKDSVVDAIGRDAYDCVRVWSGWSYGTMGQDDFIPITEQEERVDEITQAAIDAIDRILTKRT